MGFRGKRAGDMGTQGSEMLVSEPSELGNLHHGEHRYTIEIKTKKRYTYGKSNMN